MWRGTGAPQAYRASTGSLALPQPCFVAQLLLSMGTVEEKLLGKVSVLAPGSVSWTPLNSLASWRRDLSRRCVPPMGSSHGVQPGLTGLGWGSYLGGLFLTQLHGRVGSSTQMGKPSAGFGYCRWFPAPREGENKLQVAVLVWDGNLA